MSYHEIEDIVESCVFLIDESTLGATLKKQYILELFAFQLLFDTSDTFARVDDILKKYHIKEKEIQERDFDALRLFAEVLELSLTKHISLSQEIYSIFLNAYFQGDLENYYLIPEKFEDFIEHTEVLRIRNIIEQYPKICKKHPQSGKSESYDIFPDIRFEKEIQKDASKRALISLLTEPQKSRASIIEALKKELSQKTLENPWQIIHHFVKQQLGSQYRYSQVLECEKEIQISFMKKKKDSKYHEIYLCICIFLDQEEKYMNLKLGFQFGNILVQQNRKASLDAALQHDMIELYSFLLDEDTLKNTHLHRWGGWKYDTTKSEKILLGHFENMIQSFGKYESNMQEIFLSRLQAFENFSFAQYQKELQSYDKLDFIPIEKHFPFTNMEGILVYLILFHRTIGNKKLAQSYRDIFDASVSDTVSDKRYQKHLAFTAYLDGLCDTLPEFFHAKNIFFDGEKRKVLMGENVL